LPSRDEHLEKAQGNETFAASITHENQTRIDWTLIVLFYAAVHYVEAYLGVRLGLHARSHTMRDNYVAKDANLRKIYSSYQHLKYFGYNARYEVFRFTVIHIQEATNCLADIKTKLLPLL
jgi:hypothetical protein